jgi:hypothetical protein
MDISFNPAGGDEGRGLRTYQGELTILPPSSASCALVEFARDQIEASFAPRHPQHAHGELAVTESLEILARLKPQFIHDPQTRKRLLVDVGSNPHQTFGARQKCASRKTYLLAFRIPVPSLHWGGLVSSAFRFLDRVLMSVAGPRFSSESALGASHNGIWRMGRNDLPNVLAVR